MSNQLLQDKNHVPSDELWKVEQGEDNGLPLIFRIRKQQPNGIESSVYPHLIAILWTYESTNDYRMPSPEISALMTQFEQLLDSPLEESKAAFLTVVVTGNSRREWQWYSRNPEEMIGIVNHALKGYEPFPVEFSIQDDPQWEAYKHF